MSIIVTGSLAFDHILQFPGYFEEHINPEQLNNINISFLVDNMKKMKGGCASNIAYSLALLGNTPTIMATAGKDFEDFERWLNKRGVDTSLIKKIEDKYTASCFIITDQNNNQITGFYGGAMADAGLLSFKDIDYKNIQIAIISPNAPNAMIQYCKECRELGIPFIFDPGQQIPRTSPEDLLECITGSIYTIMNDYELSLVIKKTKKTQEELLKLTKTIIKTLGADGCVFITKDGETKVSPAKPLKVLDPTGAGDAFRAGLITGYLKNLSIEQTAKIANTIAVYVVEQDAPAEHNFTHEEFAKRYEENYKEKLPNIF